MDKITFDLDIVDENGDDLRALIERSLAGGVELTVHTLNGPGGGNPFVAVSGSRYALLGWLTAEYTGGNVAEAERFLDED